MKNYKIVIAGGTGFIGQEMIRFFGPTNQLTVLSRQLDNSFNNRNRYNSLTQDDVKNVEFIKWNGKTLDHWSAVLNGADLVINLAGKSVNCRYNEQNRKEILESRVDAVKVIGAAIQECSQPPRLWINASTATIYRHALDMPQDEYSTEFHEGFSVNVCREWEKAFYDQSTPVTRKVALRMAITLGPGGVLIPYFNLLKYGLGGKQGSGKQMFSWVHIEDNCRMIEHIMTHPGMEGTYNCCSPYPVTNTAFMRTLRMVTGKRIGLPAFEWMLKLGAVLIGTETELILKSRWVLPTRVLESGFVFKYPHLQDAFTDIISKIPGKQYQLF